MRMMNVPAAAISTLEDDARKLVDCLEDLLVVRECRLEYEFGRHGQRVGAPLEGYEQYPGDWKERPEGVEREARIDHHLRHDTHHLLSLRRHRSLRLNPGAM
jgi:hypothetical protein